MLFKSIEERKTFYMLLCKNKLQSPTLTNLILAASILSLTAISATPAFAAPIKSVSASTQNTSTMKTSKLNGITYYLVETEEQLRSIGKDKASLSKFYLLNNDITLTKEWTAIGTEEAPFTGKFDGNGYKISNLKITDQKAKYVGFFGYAENASIHNLQLTNVNIEKAGYKGSAKCATVCIAMDCKVSDCGISKSK